MELLEIYLSGVVVSFIMMVIYNRTVYIKLKLDSMIMTSVFSWVGLIILTLIIFINSTQRYMESDSYKNNTVIKFLEGR